MPPASRPTNIADAAARATGAPVPGRAVRWLFAAGIVLPLLTFAVASWANYRLLMDEAHRRAARSVEVVREHALRSFAVHELILDQVQRRASGRSWGDVPVARDLHEEMRQLARRSQETSSVFVLAADGRRWLSSRQFPMPEIDGSDRDYYRHFAAGGGGTFISVAQVGRLEGDPFFTIARALGRDGEAFDGVMAVSVRVPYFEEVYQKLLEDRDDAVSLVRADGALLVRYPRAFMTGYVFPPTSGLLQAVQKADRGFFPAQARLDGIDRIYAYSKVGAYPLYIAYGLSTRAIWETWLKNVLIFAGATAATIALLTLATYQTFRGARREHEALARWSGELERREAAETALRRVQRLDALGQLTGGVIHDFSNILHVLKANVALLRRGRAPTPEMVDALDRATSQGERLARQLLAFSRQQELMPVRVDTHAFFETLAPMVRQSLASNITLHVEVAAEVDGMVVDPHELELALLNIAINARDAMPHGGTFYIDVGNAPTGNGDPRVRIACRDTGTGMPPEVLERVFEPFFTTKAVGKGTGLGLAQVYGFVTQSGGTVTISSTMGEGTEIALSVPAATTFEGGRSASAANEEAA
jgi:two-component system NtrC family sensor kinase